MLRTTRPTTWHHNPADWNIFYMRFLLPENIRIPCLDVTECSVTSRDVWGEGITSLCMANPVHTNAPQQTVTHAIPTILPALLNKCFILIMVTLRLPQSLNTVAWFYSYLFLHTVLRYFYYQHMSPVHFLHLFKLCFIAKSIQCQHTIYISN